MSSYMRYIAYSVTHADPTIHQEVGQGTACFSWQVNARDNGVVGTR
jgi:hypothetical protein